jgi:hypothetical protein
MLARNLVGASLRQIEAFDQECRNQVSGGSEFIRARQNRSQNVDRGPESAIVRAYERHPVLGFGMRSGPRGGTCDGSARDRLSAACLVGCQEGGDQLCVICEWSSRHVAPIAGRQFKTPDAIGNVADVSLCAPQIVQPDGRVMLPAASLCLNDYPPELVDHLIKWRLDPARRDCEIAAES